MGKRTKDGAILHQIWSTAEARKNLNRIADKTGQKMWFIIDKLLKDELDRVYFGEKEDKE